MPRRVLFLPPRAADKSIDCAPWPWHVCFASDPDVSAALGWGAFAADLLACWRFRDRFRLGHRRGVHFRAFARDDPIQRERDGKWRAWEIKNISLSNLYTDRIG